MLIQKQKRHNKSLESDHFHHSAAKMAALKSIFLMLFRGAFTLLAILITASALQPTLLDAQPSLDLSTDKEYETIIVGAGASGLTAAYYLQHTDILVLERNESSGGRVRSEKKGHVVINWGAQYLPDQKSVLDRFLSELDVDFLVHPATTVKIGYAGEITYHEDFTTMGIGVGPVWDILRMVSSSYRRSRRYTGTQELTSADRLPFAISDEDFTPEVSEFVSAFINSASSAPLHRISSLWFDVLMTDLLSPIKFVEGGTEEITNALAEEIEPRVMYSAEVERISQESNIVRVQVCTPEGPKVFRARNCILTIPAPLAVDIVEGLPGWKIESLLEVEYGSYVTVALQLANTTWQRGLGAVASGHVFSSWIDQNMAQGDPSEPSVSRPATIILFITTSTDSELWKKSDPEILELVKQDFVSLFPKIESAILDAALMRFPFGEPVAIPGYFGALKTRQEPVGRIHFAGDYTDEPWLGGALMSGMRAAKELGAETPWVPPLQRSFRSNVYSFWVCLTSTILSVLLFLGTIPAYRKIWAYVFSDTLGGNPSHLENPPEKVVKWGKVLRGCGLICVVVLLSASILLRWYFPPMDEVFLSFAFISLALPSSLLILMIFSSWVSLRRRWGILCQEIKRMTYSKNVEPQ